MNLAVTSAGLLLAIAVLLGGNAPEAPERARAMNQGTVPRTVLALYAAPQGERARGLLVQALAEAPLNHLGLVVRYHNIREGLPAIESLRDVRGVLTWFTSDAMPKPNAYLEWVVRVARSGRPLVVMGQLGALADEQGRATPMADVNRALAQLGWRYDDGWNTTTYDATYLVRDRRVVEFERSLPSVIPPYARVRATAADARTFLRVGAPGRASTESDLVIVTPRGSFVAPGFAYFSGHVDSREFRQWYVNPYELFREAFRTDDLPKPDAATLVGRRIFYSHIDGDGWRNLTQIEPYRTRYVIAARVVLEAIIKTHTDLPVTVGPVVGDLDPAWKGTTESLAVARETFAMPNVEASIHTYSHPLNWRSFKEAPRSGRDPDDGVKGEESPAGSDVVRANGGDLRPWKLRNQALSLQTEIDAAASFVNRLLPAGKRVALMQWSGDTTPDEQAIQRTRLAGLVNLNGGETRFDREYPSTAWVAPLGERVGRELQVYSSNSSENTYTDLWQDRFFGFSFLSRTVRNTGSPRRLKPFNVYFHMYSGDRLSSLNAVLANLDYARTQSLVPIEASRFARIVNGFFDLTLEATGPRAWRIRDRQALQTIRFDRAALEAVDFARSRGVIGQRHGLGSLMVALDEEVAEPIIALKSTPVAGEPACDREPYLVESRWRVYGVQQTERGVRFATEGYGPGEATWCWPWKGSAMVRWEAGAGQRGETRATVSTSGVLSVTLPQLTATRVDVAITTEGNTQGDNRRGRP